jgi:hypothetical protein
MNIAQYLSVLARHRSLPEGRCRRLPALLNGIGQLEMAAGDFPAARPAFQSVTPALRGARLI